MGGYIEKDRYREVEAETTARRGVSRMRSGDGRRQRDSSRLPPSARRSAATRLEREAVYETRKENEKNKSGGK